MRAVWYDRQGPANEVLVQGELPTPEPGLGEVRVRLEAAGVNPSDTYRRRGAVPAGPERSAPVEHDERDSVAGAALRNRQLVGEHRQRRRGTGIEQSATAAAKGTE